MHLLRAVATPILTVGILLPTIYASIGRPLWPFLLFIVAWSILVGTYGFGLPATISTETESKLRTAAVYLIVTGMILISIGMGVRIQPAHHGLKLIGMFGASLAVGLILRIDSVNKLARANEFNQNIAEHNKP